MKELKLFRVGVTERVGYDEYDSFVICCETEQEARETNPSSGNKEFREFDGWVKREQISGLDVDFIGMAAEGIEEGIICASFNAG